MLTSLLDKSAQVSTCNKLKYQNKALFKARQINFANQISNYLDKSTREWNYVQRAKFCSSVITQNLDKVRTNYCNSRICYTCEKIRKAKRIDSYLTPISNINQPHFVTLTKVSVSAEDLRSTIFEMNVIWRKYRKAVSRQGIKTHGIRTLEFNYNPLTEKFNPHYHIVINEEVNANFLKLFWLNSDESLSKNANDVRVIKNPNKDTLFEVFAYTNKSTYGKYMLPKQTAQSITALMDIRTLNTFGNIRKVKHDDDLEALDSSSLNFKEISLISKDWIWDYEFKDWRFEDELLSEIEYDEQKIKFISNVNQPKHQDLIDEYKKIKNKKFILKTLSTKS